MMVRTAFALVMAAALAALPRMAAAADVPLATKAPAVVGSAYNWSGLYVGANFGWGWTSADWTNVANTTLFGDSVPPDRFSHAASGVIGGAQVGINIQYGAWVFGAEALFDGSGMSGEHASAFGAADDQFTGSIDALLLLTGRIGYAVNNWLAYAKGGYAGALVRAAVSDTVGPQLGSGSETRWRSGWTVGGGVEYGFGPNLSAALEYNYIELEGGRHELGGAAGSYAWTVTPRPINLVMAKLNYRFNVGR
jgi:outer membrane immunogenic protein